MIELPARDAALLAWLALEGPTPRARLAALLWPDSDVEAGRNALRQRLFQLRRLLGTDAVVGQATLSLAEGLTHDLEHADRVLGDRTPVMGGEFALWLELQRSRRRARICQSLAELADMAEGVGDWGDALSHAQEILALEPLSEDAHRRMMRLYYLSGDRAAALLAFDRCERLLKDEVGTPPDARTLALLRQINETEAACLPPPPAMPAALLRPPRLVGRGTAWAQLTEAWQASVPLLMRGEAGMGKSRLLADFVHAHRAEAADPLLVAIGARPGDGERRYAVLSRLLRATIATPGWRVDPQVTRELAAVLPELGEPPPSGPLTEVRLANAVASALAPLSAVVIDDLQWADPDSLALLQGAICAGSPRWLLATRPVDDGSAEATWQTCWVDSSQARVIDLLPLDAVQVADLLGSLGALGQSGLPDPAALHRRTGGNPLFLLECLRADWGECRGGALPSHLGHATDALSLTPRAVRPMPMVRRQIQHRLLRGSPMAVRLMRCAAVAGQDFGAGLAAAVLRVRPLDLADAWAELERAQVLAGNHFAHDLVYEAALDLVPAPIAAELHGEIAAALHSSGAAPHRVAAHWIQAGQPARAVAPLLEAARQAQTRRDDAQAGRWFVQAADLLENQGHAEAACDALLSAADVQSNLGAGFTAHADRIAALARTEAQVLFADVIRCAQWVHEGRLDLAAELAEAGRRRAQQAGVAEAESEFEWSLFHCCWARGDLAQAIEHGERDLAIKRTLPPQGTRLDQTTSLGTRLTSVAMAHMGSGRFSEARALHDEALAYMVAHRMVHHQALGAANYLSAELVLGRLPQARALSAHASRLLDDGLTHELDRLHVLNGLGVLHWLDGQWGLALRRLEQLEESVPSLPAGSAAALTATHVGLLLAIGRRDLALQSLERIERRLPPGLSTARTVHDVYRCAASPRRGGEALLAPVSAVGNLLTRVRLLLALAPTIDAEAVLPLLAWLGGQVRDGGGWGLWLALQARYAATLARLGRHGESAAVANAAWQRYGTGSWPMLPLPDFAADLAESLLVADPAQSALVARAGRDALTAATDTLEATWRRSCRERSPWLQRLNTQLARLGVA